MTEYHRLEAENNMSFFSYHLEARSQKSRSKKSGWTLSLETAGENRGESVLCLLSSCCLQAVLASWPRHSNLPLPISHCLLFSMSRVPLLSYNTLTIGFRASLDNAGWSTYLKVLNLVTSTKTPILNNIVFTDSRIRI